MINRIREYFGGIVRRYAMSWMYRPLASPFGIYSVESGANVNEDKAISWTAIWRGLQLVGSAIGSMPFSIIEEDGEGNIKTRRDHPMWGMINMEPHPYYSTFDFLSGIVYQLLLHGNAVVIINRRGLAGGSNRPENLRLVEWRDVTDVKESVEDQTIYYTIKGIPERIPHDNIIHIKGITKDGIAGIDMLEWNKESFGLAISSERAVAAYYKNGTHAEGFLTSDSQYSPDQRQDLQKAWNDRNRAGETPFLTGGVKWNAISSTPKEIQLLESRQFNVYEAARLLGISPHLLFAMDRANFSNVETMSLEFAKYTLHFLVERIEQEFSRKLFRKTELGKVKVHLNMDAFLRGDTEARANYLQSLLDRGVLSIDEARRIEGYNSLEEDQGKVHMVPLNFQTLDQMNSGEVQSNNEDAQLEDDNEPMPNGRAKHLNGHHKILN